MMRKYRDSVDALNRLQHNWARYVKVRMLLSLAVDWATLDPPPNLDDRAMGAIRDQLGDEIVAWVNRNRLAGLRPRPPLAAGKVKLDQLLQELPELASLVRKKADRDLAASEQLKSLAPFDEYARRMAVLRSANVAVRDYLAVDVTVSKEDVNEIADAIKKLGRGE